MKQEFIINNKSNQLQLFFAGWGMDCNPFRWISGKTDFYICYDYTQMESLNVNALKNYNEIVVYAWSLGVWAAEQILSEAITPQIKELHIRSICAIAGTPFPIDEQLGIAPSIYEGTLNGLNERSLNKFNLRMCGNTTEFKAFNEVSPQRTIESLREELAAIRFNYLSQKSHPHLEWDMALVMEQDRIFPAQNQQNAWNRLQVETRRYPFAHYNKALFNSILG